MKTKQIFTSIILSLSFLILSIMFLASWQGTGIARAQGPEGDVGVASGDDTYVNIQFPIPTDGLTTALNVDVGDTVNIPVQLATRPNTDTVNFAELTFQLPPNNIIQVLDVVPVASNFSTGITSKNIAPNNSVTFRVDFLPGVPGGVAPFTIANIRIKVLKPATPADFTFSTISRIGYTTQGGIAPPAEFLLSFTDTFRYNNVIAPNTVITPNDTIPFNIRYPQMIVYIDERLTTPPNYTIKVGETVQTQVKMSEIAGVKRIKLKLAASPSIVSLNSVTPASPFALTSVNTTTNEIELTASGPVFVSNDTVIATLNWEGISPGSLGQTFELLELYDADNVLITDRAPVTLNGGTITVEDQEIRIFLDPSSLTIPAVGQTGVQVVKTEGVFNVGTLDFILTFDESVVDVDSLQVSSLYNGATAGVIGNSINFSYSGPRISEDGDVLIITWVGVGGGTNKDVSFSQSDLVVETASGTPISSVTAERGFVSVGGSTATPTATPTGTPPTATPTGTPPTATPTGTPPTATPTPTGTPPSGAVSGIIEAQGRGSNQGGAEIFTSTSSCENFTPSGSATTTTNADGSFSVNTQGVQCLRVFRDGHLSGQRSNPSGNLGTLLLPAGDVLGGTTGGLVPGNDKVDLFDLAKCASQYQQTGECDFNGSGVVDIVDLAIVGTNYNRTGPVSDWK